MLDVYMSHILVISIVLLNILLGLGIFLRNPRSRTNRWYAAFVASVSVWIVANYLENEPGLVGYESLDFFLRVDFAFAALFYYLWFRFVSLFVRNRIELDQYRWVRWIQLLATTPLFVTPFIGGALITDIQFDGSVITFGSGPFWTYYATLINVYMVLGLAVLVWGRRVAGMAGNTLMKTQIDYMFIGAAVSLTIALLVNLPQAIYPITLEISRVGLYSMGFLVVFTGFAIVRARFFEIKLTLARAVVFLLLSVLVAALCASALFLMAGAAFHIAIDPRMLVSTVIISILVASLFEYVRRIAQHVTDTFLYKGQHDPDVTLKKIGKILIETLELEDVSKQIMTTVCDDFRLEKVALLLESNRGMIWFSEGFPQTFPSDLQPILSGKALSQIISYDEIPEGPQKELFRAYDIALTVPLYIKGKNIALFLLGHKRSGEPFSEEEVSFLDVLAPEMAIGIQNAKSYDDLKQLNKELEMRVTDRTKQLEDLQGREVAKAQEVARLKDEFVFFAVHELRAPIIAIQGFLELTEGAQKNFPLDIRHNLEAMNEASIHMSQLINDLLEIARSDSGTMKIDVSPEEIEPILKNVLKQVAPRMIQKHIKLNLNVNTIPRVMCDPQKLKEVLENLIGNAIKYNKDAGEIFISLYQAVEEPNVIFEIRDTGYGIPKIQQPEIFKKFFRAVTHETQEVMGTGLGLFITRMLVERMGGELMFSSVEHQGSTFSFTLPVAKEN